LEHLTQYGTAGLEMAIRMGMGIGMGLGQQALQQQHQMQQQQQQEQSAAGSSWQQSSQPNGTVTGSTSQVPSPRVGKSERPQTGNIVSEIMNKEIFPTRASRDSGTPPTSNVASFPASRRPSIGDVGSPGNLDSALPEDAAKQDPLATQVWKAYAKAKETLPNGQRMENLTWRMMHLTLKKKEEMAAAAAAAAAAEEEAKRQQEKAKAAAMPPPPPAPVASTSSLSTEATSTPDEQQRGRRKGKSRIVGFQKNDSPSPGPE
jgi:GATA-binding protein